MMRNKAKPTFLTGGDLLMKTSIAIYLILKLLTRNVTSTIYD